MKDNKTLIYDFIKIGEEFVAATEAKVVLEILDSKVPQIELQGFKKGTRGEEFTIWLQLKTIADIGIIGLPNAGKSSLLAINNANPKITTTTYYFKS